MQPPAKKTSLFRRTPPAIFPPIFGLFGLGLAWRRAADGFSVSPAIGDIILGAVTLLYLFALVAYAAKFIRRPAVFGEDLKTLPGRAGLAAMSLSGMLLAASLLSYSTQLALGVLIAAVILHIIIIAMILRVIFTGPAEAKQVTPVWHLVFVGLILSPFAAIPLGFGAASSIVFAVTLGVAIVIWGVSLRQLIAKEMPAPLRPVLAIHLAPAGMLGSVAYLLGYGQVGFVFGILAIVILAALIIRIRWITAAGFSPFWGAFTFPVAAFSTLMQIMGAAGEGEIFRILGGIVLVGASIMTPIIAWKILQLWAKGVLAVKTNAAQV